MPIYITQGRYTREAIKGMIVKPEDRYEALSRHVARVGGRVMSYYMTFGEYDFLTVVEAPSETQMAAVLLSAAATGGVSDLRTTLAMTSIEAKGAFAAASDLAPPLVATAGRNPELLWRRRPRPTWLMPAISRRNNSRYVFPGNVAVRISGRSGGLLGRRCNDCRRGARQRSRELVMLGSGHLISGFDVATGTR